MSEQIGPIEDDELLLRRIPIKQAWYDPRLSNHPDQDAFKPHPKADTTGLSVSRARSSQHPEFLTVEAFATAGPSPHGYYVAVLRAGDLRYRGIKIVADPLPGDPGHSLLPELNSVNRNDPATKATMRVLAFELTVRVEGPFTPKVANE